MLHQKTVVFPELTLNISFEVLPEHKLKPAPEFVYTIECVPNKMVSRIKIDRTIFQKYILKIVGIFAEDVYQYTTHTLSDSRETKSDRHYVTKGEKVKKVILRYFTNVVNEPPRSSWPLDLKTEEIDYNKLLWVAHELHKSGYENLEVVPVISPSDEIYRCFFKPFGDAFNEVMVSYWFRDLNQTDKRNLGVAELAKQFEEDHPGLVLKCKGSNPKYVAWYYKTLLELQEGELPFAYSEYFVSDGFWRTTHKRVLEGFLS